MTTTSRAPLTLAHRFADELPELVVPWQADPLPAPRALALNAPLAVELGLDADWLATPDGIRTLSGADLPPGAHPVAMVYAGHQFGGYSPRLGDGRALLLGELSGPSGLRDVHLKGSGRTPLSRGGDGKAVVGPMLREYVISEAMAALGIPTTRSLAVLATGEQVARETMLPGALLVRLAASHIRVGTFEFAARLEDRSVLRRLADHAIARHHPQAAEADNPYLGLFAAVVDAQAALVASWMTVGFIHGVMNTDNMTISGETIDYGPCAFMDRFDPSTVFSSIDHGGRYAYGNQPGIAHWNLARLAETLLGLVHDDADTAIALATEVLEGYADRFRAEWRARMRAKLGLRLDHPDDPALYDDLLALLHEQRADHTQAFRSLSSVVRDGRPDAFAAAAGETPAVAAWLVRYATRRAVDAADPAAVAAAMDRVNPIYIPRNHLVEEALAAATEGDGEPLDELVSVLAHPFEAQPGRERYAEPAPDGSVPYRTFCGT